MIALVYLPGTVAKEIGEDENGNRIVVDVPDINFPNGQAWTAFLTDHGVPVFQYHRNNRYFTALVLGPFTIGPDDNAYVIDMQDGGLTFLRNRLGSANIAPFVRALNNRRQVRRFVRAQGWGLERNAAGSIVNVRIPLTICGRQPYDDDEDERETLPALGDIE